MTGPQRLHTDLIDFGKSLGCGWTPDSMSSGQQVFKKLTDALWYIDHAHKRFRENSCPIPSVFECFKGYNNYSKFHHTAPIVSSVRLTEICSDLAGVCALPSMGIERNKKLNGHIENLMNVLAKYNERLIKNRAVQKKCHTRNRE